MCWRELTVCHRFGLSFLGLRWSEAKLISYAYAFEQLTQVRNKVQPYVSCLASVTAQTLMLGQIVPNVELVDIVGL